MRNIVFSAKAFNEFNEWAQLDKALYNKLATLINEIAREPFKGKGKPEPLKGELKGFWSRRINEEHRIIYKVDDQNVFIAKCKGHYD